MSHRSDESLKGWAESCISVVMAMNDAMIILKDSGHHLSQLLGFCFKATPPVLVF